MTLLRFLLGCLVFGLAYAQAPLYYSNQNQYFLHGLARAGWGHLDQDWLAKTADPTPVFSALVEITYRFLPEFMFHIYYLLIFGVYLFSMVELFKHLTGKALGDRGTLLFITLFTLLHSALLRIASVQLLKVDYPWYFQAGVAGQYVLGAMFQPSVFGVLLIASIVAFVRDRPWLAVTLAALAGVMHATYLLAAAALVIAFMESTWRHAGWKKALGLGLLALILVLPVVTFVLWRFGPTSLETFNISREILAWKRIPHHADVTYWFDGIAALQVLWIVAAIGMTWGTRLTHLMTVPLLIGLLGTLFSANAAIALLFPWRISAVLVPIATTIVLTRFVQWLLQRPRPAWLYGPIACTLVLGCLALGGVAVNFFDLGFRTNNDELPLLDWVKTNKAPGDVYLLPVDLPKRGGRGAASTNFTPAPRAEKAGTLIAIDLQRFRLSTGAPIYVDFKAIPYKDVEVLRWWQRIEDARRWLKDDHWASADGKASLRGRGITHVVVPVRSAPPKGRTPPVYVDDYYHVYRLVP